jgi:hypothetical protein
MALFRSSAALMLSVVLLFAAPSQAQQYRHNRISTLLLKFGGGNYTGDLGNYTAIGPTYGVALNMQPLPYLGFEIGYDGSRNELQTLRFPALRQATFWRNGGSAMVKLCVPYEPLRPFVGAGFGLGFTSVTGSSNGGQFVNDLFGELPMMAGLEVNAEYFTAGVRVTYHVLLDEGFVQTSAGAVHGGLLDLQATLGVRF